MASSAACGCFHGQFCPIHNMTAGCGSTIPKNSIHPPPLMGNNILDVSKNSSNRRRHITDDSDSDFQLVTNNRIQRKIRRSKDILSQNSSANYPLITAPHSHLDSHQNITTNHPNINVFQNPIQSNAACVSSESQRYALSRFPFPAFIIRFNSGSVSATQIKSSIIEHCLNSFQTSIQILFCRVAKRVPNVNHYDCFIFVRDGLSFSFLLNESHWPSSFMTQQFSFPSKPSIPPQLCLLMKNVDLNIDFDLFCADIKEQCPSIKNIIRMKNKFQNDIAMVKLEFLSSADRDDILNKKRFVVNHVSYDICEFLAPAHVLICSHCMGIGHFKKQCQQIKMTCHICSELIDDIQSHNCSNIEKCLHCNQNHKSNSLKCPVIKKFRAELTRTVLRMNNEPAPINMNQHSKFFINPSHFPPLNVSNSTSPNNSIINKLDDLISRLSSVQSQLTNLETKHDKFEQFMNSKIQSDKVLQDSMNKMLSEHVHFNDKISQINLSIDHHENLSLKLIFPLFDDICCFISHTTNPKNKSPDANIKSKIDRYRLLINKAIEGKKLSI